MFNTFFSFKAEVLVYLKKKYIVCPHKHKFSVLLAQVYVIMNIIRNICFVSLSKQLKQTILSCSEISLSKM